MDSIWKQKGATLSDKSARKEFGLTQQEIYEAMRAGKLQFQQNSMHGNPWFRLLRHEVEDLVREKSGKAVLHKKKLQKELADIDKEARKLKTRLKTGVDATKFAFASMKLARRTAPHRNCRLCGASIFGILETWNLETTNGNRQRRRIDPNFCEHRCPICSRARQESQWAKFLQAIEMLVTFGRCPWGRARQKKCGVRSSESLPPQKERLLALEFEKNSPSDGSL